MEVQWETELAELLSRLSAAQKQLLDLLTRKREFLVQRDHRALAALSSAEEELCAELQACHERRKELLATAAEAGMPADSIRSLVGFLPAGTSQALQEPIDGAQRRAKLLRHHCLSQWVAVQRTMLHLSHLIEIIATRGQLKPTYGKGDVTASSGALMDQAV